ncbi:sugar transferase [bacterium]|nr:sugar transferase [bacterium]MBU1982859.1 sugar transferase [bacterium]
MSHSRLWSLLLFLDIILLQLAFFGVYWWRFQSGQFVNPVSFQPGELLIPSLIVCGYWVLLLAWFGLYRFDPLQSRAVAAARSFRAAAVGALILFILTFNPQRPLPSSRIILAAYGMAIFLIVSGNRVGLLTILREFRIRGIGAFRTLLVGRGSRADTLLKYLEVHPGLGLHIAGFVGSPSSAAPSQPVRYLGNYSLLRKLLRHGAYQAVLLAPDDEDERQLGRIVRLLQDLRVRAFISADQYRLLIGQVKPTRIPGHPLVDVRPELLSLTERALKRLTDIVISASMLLITLPLWILLAILIPLDSPGSIFYSQRRVGRNGRTFRLYKFRSMIRNAEKHTGPVLTQQNDPRITPIGQVIRRTRLDELPQLINVLSGRMSMVGPRPERVEFVKRFVREIPLYERRLNVKPGITGWSQVHLRYDSRADQIAVKLQHDFFYIENMSLPLDLRILFMTLFVVLRGEGL